MCGITGYFAHEPAKDRLLGSLQKLDHRGPDGSGCLFLESGRVGLGHARLSIVDLFGGQQPLVNREGTVYAVVNGEFYEFERIRSDLMAKGHTFRTRSDSEILLALYEEYGLDLFSHLNGEFAFILYDAREKRALLARDRFGIKPLFYHQNEEGCYAASEIKALLPYGIPARWNLDAVMMADFFIPCQRQTIFAGVHAVKPGHCVVIEKGRIEERPYWDFSYPSSTEELAAPTDEQISELRRLLTRCVATRLHGDVPVAAYVSGGLDSTAILAIVAKELKREITAFNICFDDENYDESALSRRVAEALGVAYVPVDASVDALADHFADAVYHNEGLIYNNQSVAKFILSRAVRDAGYKVVLTGEGADEVFAGYPFFREDLIRSAEGVEKGLEGLRRSNSSVSHAFLSDSDELYDLAGLSGRMETIPSMWRVGARYGHLFRHQIYSTDFRDRVCGRNPFVELVDSLPLSSLAECHPVNRSLYLWAKTNLPEVILSFLGDRMEMAHSVEGRLPFLDFRLVEYCQKLPVGAKIWQGTEKFILREAVRDVIPSFIYERQKFPFSAPPVLRRDKKSRLKTLMLDTIHSDLMDLIPFYDKEKVRRYVETVTGGPQEKIGASDPVMNRVVSAATLAQRFHMTC